MNRKPLTQRLAAALTVAFFTAIVPNQTTAAERNEHKELPAGSGGTLTFKTVVGAIKIKTHDTDEVTYNAELKPVGGRLGPDSASVEDVVFDYQTSGSDVKITMKWKDDKQPRIASLNARHTLLVPARYNLDVRTAGGSIVAGDIKGRVVAHTSGGNIRFGTVTGETKGSASGGSISAELAGQIEQPLELSTSGGSIKVTKR